MTLLHDAYTALLSGLTHKTGNEIHWQDNNKNQITIEPINIEKGKYIIRYYDENGKLYLEIGYKNGKLHGKYKFWYNNGNPNFEEMYQNGKLKK